MPLLIQTKSILNKSKKRDSWFLSAIPSTPTMAAPLIVCIAISVDANMDRTWKKN